MTTLSRKLVNLNLDRSRSFTMAIHTYPLVYDNISIVINRGAYILENLHLYCDPITDEDFALTFFKKLTSNTGKGCTTLRGRIPTFVIRVLIYANMIQTK